MKNCNAQIKNVKELLHNIVDVAVGYDGFSEENSLKGLIDEMSDWACEALKILEKLPRDSRGKEEINNLMHRINLFDKKVREIAELLGVCYAGVDTDHDSIILAIKELQEDFNLLCRIEKM